LPSPVMLDGEIVAFDEAGKPDFAALWFRNRGSSDRPICFMAFDVLHVDGAELVDKPYSERRKILESFELAGPTGALPTST
jgi:bifunctional non-homologous end joining protein LigD